jgi:hypothetical protein
MTTQDLAAPAQTRSLAAAYLTQLSQSRSSRRTGSTRFADGIAFAALTGSVLFLLAATFAGRAFEPAHHFEEGGAVAALSALLLSASAAFALAAFYVRMRAGDLPALFWLAATLGLGFLAVDELVQIHEYVGDFLEDKYGDSGPFRNWNDILVIFYGIAAAGLGLFFLPEVLRHARLLEFLLVAGPLFVVHTAIDSVAVDPTPLSVICEESAKLLCVTMIAAAFAAGLMSVLDRAHAEGH